MFREHHKVRARRESNVSIVIPKFGCEPFLNGPLPASDCATRVGVTEFREPALFQVLGPVFADPIEGTVKILDELIS